MKRITILCDRDGNSYTVIIDGRITERLTWEEMLGHVAQATLTGKGRFGSVVLGEPDHWTAPKGLLTGGAHAG